jgi:hypothetical protein
LGCGRFPADGYCAAEICRGGPPLDPGMGLPSRNQSGSRSKRSRHRIMRGPRLSHLCLLRASPVNS